MLVELAYQQLLQQLETLYEKREATTIANWVIEHITGLKRMDRIIQKKLLLNSEQETKLAAITNRLLNSEPIQYVVGEAWFAGNRYQVNPDVLIPRPETEELVEWILADDAIQDYRLFLDIGTGSGCIPITIKLKKPQAFVVGFDISQEALTIANKNAKDLNAAANFMQVDILDETRWQNFPLFNCIISNPPYIKASEHSNMSKHVKDFEPTIALFVPDEDPLIFYRKIAAFGFTHLEKNGTIYFEINQTLGNEVIGLLQQFGYTAELKKDLNGNDRMVKASLII